MKDARKAAYRLGQSNKVCPDVAAAAAAADGGPDALKPRAGARAPPPAAAAAAGAPAGPSSWADLPEPLLDMIFRGLAEGAPPDAKPRALLLGSSACRAWRAAAAAAFEPSPWRRPDLVVHPRQLVTLCPPHLARPGGATGGHSHLLKCYVRREVASTGLGGRLHRFTLCAGADYGAPDTGRYLLSAVQESKTRYALHLDRALAGRPMAHLATNVMRTAYCLAPEPGGWLERATGRGGAVAVDGGGAGGGGGEAAEGPEGEAAAGGAAPLMRAQYKVRVRGMMLPRRMAVEVPCPPHLEAARDAAARQQAEAAAAEAAAAAAAAAPSPHGALTEERGDEGAGGGGLSAFPSLSLSPSQQLPSRAARWSSASAASDLDVPVQLASMNSGLSEADVCGDLGDAADLAALAASDAGAGAGGSGGFGAAALPPAGSGDWQDAAAARLQLLQRQRMRRRSAARGGGASSAGEALDPTAEGDEGQQGEGEGQGVGPLGCGDYGREDDLARGRVDDQGLPPDCARARALDAGADAPDRKARRGAGAAAAAAAARDQEQGRQPAGAPPAAAAAEQLPHHQQQPPPPHRAPEPLVLLNKPPHWNDSLRCWCLNFRGRVKLASVKNFQLVAAPPDGGGTGAAAAAPAPAPAAAAGAQPAAGVAGGGGVAASGGSASGSGISGGGSSGSASIVMQFGKVESDLYILDFNPRVLTAVQAFAVALTTFEAKVLL